MCLWVIVVFSLMGCEVDGLCLCVKKFFYFFLDKLFYLWCLFICEIKFVIINLFWFLYFSEFYLVGFK